MPKQALSTPEVPATPAVPTLVSPTSGTINIPACVLTTEQAIQFREVLTECINCNVATQVSKAPILTRKTLWDSIKDPQAQTIDIDSKLVADFQRLKGIGDSLEKTIVGLIEFYQDAPILNFVLQPDVLASRPSYSRYSAQFAQSLRQAQTAYETVKVQFEATTGRVGIFCRKSTVAPIRTSFIQSLIERLDEEKVVAIRNEDLPQTYKTNFATLGFQLRNHYGERYKVVVTRQKPGVLISLE